eukprot:g28648.t2
MRSSRWRSYRIATAQRPGFQSRRIPLALGCSKQGHGDVLWAAAELAADAVAGAAEFSVHGLGEGARVLELGAGLGLPSAVALRLGAEVVATDLWDHERLLALSSTLALNLKLSTGGKARVMPHRWGDPCDLLCAEGLFQLILCNDCLYMPDLHGALLDTIFACLAPDFWTLTSRIRVTEDGLALICFSLHQTAPASAIFGFFDLAKARGFRVEKLGEAQRAPRCANMALERLFFLLFEMIDTNDQGYINAMEFIAPLSRWVHDSKTAPRFIKYNLQHAGRIEGG